MLRRISKGIFKKMPVMISLAMLAAAAGLKAQQLSFIEQLQFKVFDLYQQYYPRVYEPVGVRIIDIDDASLAKFGQWPWPRQILAKMVTQLTQSGAAVIAYDMVFAEPDRTSPLNIAELWHTDPQLTKQLLKLPDHDALLAEAFSQAYIVTGYVMTNGESDQLPSKKFGYSYAGMEGSKPAEHLLGFSGATLNLPMFEEAAEGNGFFNNTPDSDGIVRRVPLALNLKNEPYFSLAMEALRVLQGASSYVIKMAGASGEESYGAESGITQIRNGEFEIPTDAGGNFLVHYTPFTSDRYIPAWELFEPDFDKSKIEGHILLLGTSAPGLQDLRATPLSPSLPGVEVHAQLLEQILSGHFLYRPDWLLWGEIVMMVAMGLALMLIMSQLPALWGAVFMLAAQGGGIWFSLHMFTSRGYLLDPVTPGMVILVLYISESLRRYLQSESERKQVRGAFAQYMSPVLVEELAKHPEKLKLGGEMKVMSVLFCDIRGFTTISEQFDAQGLTQLINRFLTPMTDVILKHKGTIDKYMGDCIMAFWNAPLDDPHHARNACDAALTMFRALDELNAARAEEAAQQGIAFLPIRIGIGINSGEICVGNMGSEQRFDYSVLGDDVNLASRLEGQSKTYGANIVIGESTLAMAEGFATLELDLIKVKGKTAAVRIYNLLGNDALADSKAFLQLKELWRDALKAYRRQAWDEAENYIGLCRKQMKDVSGFDLNGLFELYEERIARFKVTPPQPDWDGVYTAESK